MKKNLNEEISRIKGMMGKIINEQFEGSDSDMTADAPMEAGRSLEDIDLDGDLVILYFNDETSETYQIDTHSRFSPGADSTYDDPGYDPELEVSITSVKQIDPIQKDMDVREFENYIQSLGALDQLMDKLHDEDAFDSAADRHYSSRYDSEDLDEGYDVKGNAVQMYEMAKNQLHRAMHELVESIQKGDKEMSMHMVMALRNITRRMDEAVSDMNK